MSEKQYWNDYYAAKAIERSNIPSQFASFVANEFVGIVAKIVDFGCGVGRNACTMVAICKK